MDQQQRARIRERNRRKRRKQVFYARIAAFLIVAALLVGIFFAVRGVMALTGDKNSVTTFQEIENRLFRRKKKVYTKPEMTEEYLTVNPYSRPGEKLPTVKSVFVHYTANAGTSAMQNRSYFENLGITGETSASAHFIIGYEGEIVQCLPLEEIGYAVKGRNYDSVSIECCYLEEDGKFTDATYQSLLQLVSWLMGKYDLSIDDVLRHYDEGGKNCPKYYVEHEEAWAQLKQDIADYIAENGTYKAPADSAEESENTEAEEYIYAGRKMVCHDKESRF